MRKWLILTALAVLVIVTGYLLTLKGSPFAISTTSSSLPGTADTDISMAPTPQSMPALWASSASTVPALVAEADVVIRARVVGEPEPRTVSFSGPMLGEDGTPIGEAVDQVTFSDTKMEVLEIYEGSTEKLITVMQTGGVASESNQGFSLEGDPIFVIGEELILFLVNISDDPIHAQGRTLYRIVNPAGRFTIQGSQVFQPAEFASSATAPKTVAELVLQIKAVVK